MKNTLLKKLKYGYFNWNFFNLQKGFYFCLFSILSSCLLNGFYCKKSTPSPYIPPVPTSTLYELISNNIRFTFFKTALIKTGLLDSLKSGGPYTIFLPDDSAFIRVGIHNIDTFNHFYPNPDSNTIVLKHFLKYHILKQSLKFNQVPKAYTTPYPTWDGPFCYISRPPYPGIADSIDVNGIFVFRSNILASDGVVHILGLPLPYPRSTVADILASNPKMTYFVQELKNFGLWDQLSGPGPFTVLAPLDPSILNVQFDGAAFGYPLPGSKRKSSLVIWSQLASRMKIDSSSFQKILFSPYIIPGKRIFSSNFSEFSNSYIFQNIGQFIYTSQDNSYVDIFSYYGLTDFPSGTFQATFEITVAKLNLTGGLILGTPLSYSEDVSSAGGNNNPYDINRYAISNAVATQPNIPAVNGVVHIITSGGGSPTGELVTPEYAIILKK